MAALLSEMIILWWIFITSQFTFDYIAQYNDGGNSEGYQEIRTIETLEYENTRSDFKCCDYREKRKSICPGTQGAFSDKVAFDINDFTAEPVTCCDVQVVDNTFVGDSK